MFGKFFSRFWRSFRKGPVTDGRSQAFSFDDRIPKGSKREAGKPRAVLEWEQAARQRINRNARPEELCGITEGMSKEQIRRQLAMLYRRHNRAAASVDAALREEAELMLDAIVVCREKYLEPQRAG
ncbi:MAG: hypothetical protein ACR2OZ_14220 [Verrucomicrobiales bacterium]